VPYGLVAPKLWPTRWRGTLQKPVAVLPLVDIILFFCWKSRGGLDLTVRKLRKIVRVWSTKSIEFGPSARWRGER